MYYNVLSAQRDLSEIKAFLQLVYVNIIFSGSVPMCKTI